MNKKIIMALLAAFVGIGQLCSAMQFARSFRTNVTTQAPRYKGQWHIIAGNDQKFANHLQKFYAFDGQQINLKELGIVGPDQKIDHFKKKSIEKDLAGFVRTAQITSRPYISYSYDFAKGTLKTGAILSGILAMSYFAGLSGIFPGYEYAALGSAIGGIAGAIDKNLLPAVRWKSCFSISQDAQHAYMRETMKM